MKLQELRNLAKEDLFLKLASCKEALGKLNYLKVVGQVDKPHQFKALRRTIARIKTLLKEPESKKKS
jgi:ribosomal protein L29